MKTRSRLDTATSVLLSLAAICVLMFCSGCLHHKSAILEGYRLDDRSGIAMLVSGAVPNADPDEFQATTVTLRSGSSRSDSNARCAIHGEVFSLYPGTNSSKDSWAVRSPSTLGWAAVSSRADASAQWEQFVRELARMHDHGCFARNLSTQAIRSLIAASIPLPANLVPAFTYSDRGERFVNLAPDMEIRIQKVLTPVSSVNPGSRSVSPVLTVDYDVVSRRGGGTTLRLKHHDDGVRSVLLGAADHRLLALDQLIAQRSVLRLFLQGVSIGRRGRSESRPVLLGTSDATLIDELTDLMRQKEPFGCVIQPAAVCVDLPPYGVSISSSIWINGHRTASAFGTSLGSLLLHLPEPKQAKALETVRVLRKLSFGRYANIQFARTIERATQLFLLPGDRVEWTD